MTRSSRTSWGGYAAGLGRSRVGVDMTFEVVLALATAGLGVAILLLRVWVPSGRVLQPGLLGMSYVALAALGLSSPPVPAEQRALHPLIVLSIGVTSFAAVALTSDPIVRPPVLSSAFALAAAAAVSEEAFFRRFLYGRLVRYGFLVAWIGSALAFALVHLPPYGVASFSVNLGAGLMFGWQRWASGGWLVPAATHLVANLLIVLG